MGAYHAATYVPIPAEDSESVSSVAVDDSVRVFYPLISYTIAFPLFPFLSTPPT